MTTENSTSAVELDVFHDHEPIVGDNNTYAETVSATDMLALVICEFGDSSLPSAPTEVHFTVP